MFVFGFTSGLEGTYKTALHPPEETFEVPFPSLPFLSYLTICCRSMVMWQFERLKEKCVREKGKDLHKAKKVLIHAIRHLLFGIELASTGNLFKLILFRTEDVE